MKKIAQEKATSVFASLFFLRRVFFLRRNSDATFHMPAFLWPGATCVVVCTYYHLHMLFLSSVRAFFMSSACMKCIFSIQVCISLPLFIQAGGGSGDAHMSARLQSHRLSCSHLVLIVFRSGLLSAALFT